MVKSWKEFAEVVISQSSTIGNKLASGELT